MPISNDDDNDERRNRGEACVRGVAEQGPHAWASARGVVRRVAELHDARLPTDWLAFEAEADSDGSGDVSDEELLAMIRGVIEGRGHSPPDVYVHDLVRGCVAAEVDEADAGTL